jgi:hypothetical protein
MIPFQNRDKTILAPATDWARFARRASYSTNYSGASTPTSAAAVIPASLANRTNQPESATALWAY